MASGVVVDVPDAVYDFIAWRSPECSQTSASILIFPDNPKQEKVRKMMCNFFPRWSFQVPFSRASSCSIVASLRSASLFFLYFFSSPPNFWMMFSPCFFTQEKSLNRKFFFPSKIIRESCSGCKTTFPPLSSKFIPFQPSNKKKVDLF